MSQLDKEKADLGYIEAALEELETYLHSGEMFGSLRGYRLPGAIAMPHLTLGGLLLSLQCSCSRTLSAQDQSRLGHAERLLETLQAKWRVAWEKKAGKEFGMRLRQWGNYLNDLQRDADEFNDYFAHEIRLRVMLSLLKPSAGEISSDEENNLGALDKRLASRFISGDFIWDEELSRGFSKGEYWYLWGNLI